MMPLAPVHAAPLLTGDVTPLALLCVWLGGVPWVALLAVGALGLTWEWVKLCGAAPLAWPGALVPGAVLAAGAFAAFLSTASGLVSSVSGVVATYLMSGKVRDYRLSSFVVAVVGGDALRA